ncbi:NlpC/P60 family protein [Zoogloea sp.]|uniref:C40 family peptidase n=1 Tax=Zoogloea sp. TaxID=49181 RepID=UPI0025F0DB82|nr:NlpC/P60 family protein [Zoogloea sp.]MCK6395546.1 NlpC/P60 family protein [Zoogloea sp.]
MARSPFGLRPERWAALLLTAVLVGCSQTPPRQAGTPVPRTAPPAGGWFALPSHDHAQEVVLYALGLLDTGYRFGGKNPEAGLDCSGMVSYIVEQVSGRKLPYNAAGIAERTRPVATQALRPGDLVFFNTLGRAYSHMGIYMGDGKFIHAPSSKGKVRVDRLDSRYFSERFEGARTLLPEV